MKNIAKMKILSRVTNYRMNNVGNPHTLTIGRVDPIIALVRITNRQIVEFTGDVMCGTRIGVPICVNTIICSIAFFVTIGVVIIIFKMPPAVLGSVSLLVADLAHDIDPGCGAAASTSTTTTPSGRCTSTPTAEVLLRALIATAIITSIFTSVLPTVTAVTTVTAITTRAAIVGAVAALARGSIG
jgi:hypothetical protein